MNNLHSSKHWFDIFLLHSPPFTTTVRPPLPLFPVQFQSQCFSFNRNPILFFPPLLSVQSVLLVFILNPLSFVLCGLIFLPPQIPCSQTNLSSSLPLLSCNPIFISSISLPFSLSLFLHNRILLITIASNIHLSKESKTVRVWVCVF